MSKVILTMSRFGDRTEFSYDSVKSAAQAACDKVDSNEAAPIRIRCNGVTVWENTDLFDDSYEKLREMAEMPSDSSKYRVRQLVLFLMDCYDQLTQRSTDYASY